MKQNEIVIAYLEQERIKLWRGIGPLISRVQNHWGNGEMRQLSYDAKNLTDVCTRYVAVMDEIGMLKEGVEVRHE